MQLTVRRTGQFTTFIGPLNLQTTPGNDARFRLDVAAATAPYPLWNSSLDCSCWWWCWGVVTRESPPGLGECDCLDRIHATRRTLLEGTS